MSLSSSRCFVVPALSGPITGGTLYNRELLGVLSEAGPTVIIEPDAPALGAALAAAPSTWLDSLYLAQAPRLRRQVRRHFGLIVHYLPSFVEQARAVSLAELSGEERTALGAADAFLVTSHFMRDALEPLVAKKQSIFVVPPGTRAELAVGSRELGAVLQAIVVASVLPGKGIESLLTALGAVLTPGDRLRLSIVGNLDADRPYAERCRRLVHESPLLAACVEFLGVRPHAQTLALLGQSELLISASVMESHGMTLADARVAGIPILARSGGNTASHVHPEAGGQLVHSAEELAAACVAISRSPAERRARLRRAREQAPAPRSWHSAARDFACYLEDWEK